MKVRLQGMLATSAAAAAILASAGIARADGMPSGPVGYERPYSWTGFYVGVQSGYEWDSSRWRPVNFPTIDTTVDHSTGLVGAQLGYQQQFGQVVVGVEADLLGAFENTWGEKACVQPGCGAGVFLTSQFRNVWTVGGRLGWDAGKWMPFVSGGYASASFSDATRIETATTDTASDVFGAHRSNGWYIGGGLDWRVASTWLVGVEYRHYDLNDTTSTPFNATTNASNPSDTTRFSRDLDTVTLRATWLFNRESVAPLK